MDDIFHIIRRFTGITYAIFAGIIVLNVVMVSLFIFKEINSGYSPQSVLEYVADHLRRRMEAMNCMSALKNFWRRTRLGACC